MLARGQRSNSVIGVLTLERGPCYSGFHMATLVGHVRSLVVLVWVGNVLDPGALFTFIVKRMST